jgi:GH24 family phage-related lysozyme (muramidase)
MVKREVPQQAYDIIKHFEGCYFEPYLCPAGYPTQGWGRVVKSLNLPMIDQQTADQWLSEDVTRFAVRVAKLIKVPVTDEQYAALISFAYNLGCGRLRASTLLHKLNQGDIRAAADEFPKWNKAGGRVLKGLTRRRLAEQQLFLS